jgi:uncharacterized protein YoaH (UPF0181 family)
MSARLSSEANHERLCQERTRELLAQPITGAEAVDLVRELLRSSEGHGLERPLDLLDHLVYLQNTVRRQGDELGRMRAELRERGSETERRQAAELDRLRQALELARGEAIIANSSAERLRATVAELRAQLAGVRP